MKAVIVKEEGRLVWDEVPDPTPGDEEVLLRVECAGVNRADLLQRRGLYPPPPGTPPWMGLEAAGTIEGTGPLVEGWAAGDRACCLLAGGGYAEEVAVPAGLLLPIPHGLTLEEAASLPETFATAYLNLVMEAGLAAGETAFIQAGASGVGVAAIQIAHNLGARVVTTVGSSEKAERVRYLGADDIILHRAEDVTARLRAISLAGGIDVVLDCLGGEDLGVQLPLLRSGGRWIIISLMKGRAARLDLRPILSNRLRLIGSTLRTRPLAEKARVIAGLRRDIWPLLESGAIRPVVDRILPVQEAARAHDILEQNLNVGKVVLAIGPGGA